MATSTPSPSQTAQLLLFPPIATPELTVEIPYLVAPGHPPILSTPGVDALVRGGAPVAIAVSGGKDSQGATLAVMMHLDAVGHTGPRILINADLGSSDWQASRPLCQLLADRHHVELVIVRRPAGDLLHRWYARQDSCVRRYANLETVTLVLPWSTPSMRFCTSEMKTHVIMRELRRRFPGQIVLNVVGERREEKSRAARPVATLHSDGFSCTWRPNLKWTEQQMFDLIRDCGMNPHIAYTAFGMSRVSCPYCFLAKLADLVAASRVEETHELFHGIVGLEIKSTFGFQGARWLADVAPHLLTPTVRDEVQEAKQRAAQRIEIERRLPKGLFFVKGKGWPERLPTDHEVNILSDVRSSLSQLLHIPANYLTPDSIHRRYAELYRIAQRRQEKSTGSARNVSAVAGVE
jgi:3'-phosphoadenosine 5'-phosphosulfate sulfotransferase (PAPS reductase)/FAD synthetase